MATLTIRNLPDSVRDAIRVAAAYNRRSMEAEVRDALERVYGAPGAAGGKLDRVRAVVRQELPAGGLVEALLAGRRGEAGGEAEGVAAGRAKGPAGKPAKDAAAPAKDRG